ncbi:MULTISPECIES: envelope stress response membrane protein PspC [unclassified Hahella]|uniref:envelope stress response membrane protein PspC n=1 Tax=unclassified Hahella TaxID=2624107 RepID=UPI001C1EAAA5|nr:MULTISPECIES: envelope stress response membrane protein PspC [unclassified Hahella]MBU6950106.1 envelope stress response membrane protein PspC [Hahella sp. HN01]MDG9671174.1 envelope stress response membrane protein PspC [Hahella sp. CR1]
MSEANKQNGYNRNLYRDPDAGWIAGVCAGLAESYGQPVWLARIVMLSVFIFSGSLGVLLYIAGVILLAKRPRDSYTPSQGRPLFDYGESASDRARQLKERMRALEMRLQSMERYVTSNRFNVNKEFKNL